MKLFGISEGLQRKAREELDEIERALKEEGVIEDQSLKDWEELVIVKAVKQLKDKAEEMFNRKKV